ncbi:hypothetical protein KM043_014495 [Ampulex compressa]|nr:hypothetical protein KM043_014495 [Ampulex compressa]
MDGYTSSAQGTSRAGSAPSLLGASLGVALTIEARHPFACRAEKRVAASKNLVKGADTKGKNTLNIRTPLEAVSSNFTPHPPGSVTRQAISGSKISSNKNFAALRQPFLLTLRVFDGPADPGLTIFWHRPRRRPAVDRARA